MEVYAWQSHVLSLFYAHSIYPFVLFRKWWWGSGDGGQWWAMALMPAAITQSHYITFLYYKLQMLW